MDVKCEKNQFTRKKEELSGAFGLLMIMQKLYKHSVDPNSRISKGQLGFAPINCDVTNACVTEHSDIKTLLKRTGSRMG